MKKKVLAGIMMAVMMMASVMSASAAGSKSGEVYTSGTSTDNHTTDLVFEGVEDCGEYARLRKTGEIV